MSEVSDQLEKFARKDLLRLVDARVRSESHLWQCYELVLYVEPRLGEIVDPKSLNEPTFARLKRAALTAEESLSVLAPSDFFTGYSATATSPALSLYAQYVDHNLYPPNL